MTTEKIPTKCEIIDGAIAILEKRGAWTQGDIAHDRSGDFIYVYDDNAVSFCANGSLFRAAGAGNGIVVREMIDEIGLMLNPNAGLSGLRATLPNWNDRRGRRKGQVIQLFKRYKATVCS